MRKMPLATAEAQTLASLLLDGLNRDEAANYLPKLLDSESLMRQISEASKSGSDIDIAPIVINFVSRTFFTSDFPASVMAADVLDILRKIASQRLMSTEQAWRSVVKIKTPSEAAAAFSELIPIIDAHKELWAIGRDHQGMDFIARGPNNAMYRLSCMDATCVPIHEQHASFYVPLLSAHEG